MGGGGGNEGGCGRAAGNGCISLGSQALPTRQYHWHHSSSQLLVRESFLFFVFFLLLKYSS